jgi:nickel transport protein
MKIKIAVLVIFFSFLSVIVSPAFAHKVNIFAYVEGDTVYTESYFPDGRRVEGGVVEVYDSQGNKLLEGKTNKDGEFNFKPPKKDDLKIILNATMGHKNSYILSADELPDVITAQKPQELESKKPQAEEITQVDLEQIKRIIDESLDERLKPIARQLAKTAQKEISFTEVIGGIGYIFGIMGVILYFLSRKRED